MSEKRCYTVKELQAMLGVSRPSVYELLKKVWAERLRQYQLLIAFAAKQKQTEKQ